MRATWIAVGLFSSVAGMAAPTAVPAQPPRVRSAADSLLDHLTGLWQMDGNVRGKPVKYSLVVQRILRDRYVELHMIDLATPPTYEARLIVGVDTSGNGYVAHWIDSFGASYSVPPASGDARGDTIRLTFPYPGNAFHDALSWDRNTDTWSFSLDGTNAQGEPVPFARYSLKRR